MRKKVLFDLDGTIIDSSEGIYGSIQYAMEKMGKEQLAQDVLRSFVGPPLIESFRGLGFDEAAAQQAVAFYRENYRQVPCGCGDQPAASQASAFQFAQKQLLGKAI